MDTGRLETGGAGKSATVMRALTLVMRAMALMATVCAWSAPASAQTFTVLPVERDAQLPEPQRRTAGRAVANAPALGPNARVLTKKQVVDRLPKGARDLSECVDVDCASHLARAAGLDFVAVVAVWPASLKDDSPGEPATVAVTLVEPDGTLHEADQPVEQDITRAATTALVHAARRRNLGDGALLRVQSQPSGALVKLDGTEVGVTPYVGAHPEGAHELVVQLKGHPEQRRNVTLKKDRPVELKLALDGSTTGTPQSPFEGPLERDGGANAERDEATARPILGPVLVGAAGLAGLGVAIGGTLADACDVRVAGRCEKGTRVRPKIAGAYGGLGAAAVFGAVLWFTLGGRSQGSEQSASAGATTHVGFGPRGMWLRGSF